MLTRRLGATVDLGFLADYPSAEESGWETEPPAPRPARPLRVALVTLCDSELEELCTASADNKLAYARRHGAYPPGVAPWRGEECPLTRSAP